MFVLYLILLAGFTLLSIILVDEEIQQFRLRRKGRYTLDMLMEHTGIFRKSVLQALVGNPPDENGLHHVSPEEFRRLPHDPWIRWPNQILLHAAVLFALLFCLWRAAVPGETRWILFASSAAYLLVCAGCGIYWAVRSGAEEESEAWESEAEWEPEGLSFEEIQGRMERDLGSAKAGFAALRSPGNAILLNLLLCLLEWVVAWRLGRSLRQIQAINHEVPEIRGRLIKTRWEIAALESDSSLTANPSKQEMLSLLQKCEAATLEMLAMHEGGGVPREP